MVIKMAKPVPARPGIEHLRGAPSRLSLIWILPLAAVLFALYIIWRSYVDRGPLIEIQFENAGGVKAGETNIRKRDVNVGKVEAVRLADDLNSVVIEARLDPQVAPYIDTDTQFWIVNARINTTEISGLSTLLSGSYIEVDWDDQPGPRQSEFVGLQEAPLTSRGLAGMRVTLSAEEAGYIYVGSPVFLRQIEVGRVERRRLSDDGTEVMFDVFVSSPYHKHIYPETKFYGVSGVEASFGAEGASVRVESIAALFTGGIAFENSATTTMSEPLMSDGTEFKLFDNRAAAQDSMFETPDDVRYRYIAEFEGSVKGLRVGAPIEFQGLRVGRVVEVNIDLPDSPRDKRRVYAVLQFQPSRLGMANVTPEVLTESLSEFVANGLRVQLASGNLLTGSLLVKLVNKPDAPEAKLDVNALPYTALPTLPSNIEAVTADVETLISNLSALPLDSLVAAATDLLRNTSDIVSSSEVKGLPAQLSESLASINTATNDLPTMMRALTSASQNANDVLEGLSPDSEIYIELSAAVRELRIAAKSIAAFAELLEENPNAVITGR
jgi:paraquat-inducible protein B